MASAFGEIKCNMCEYEKGCSLREIAPELFGCMGHGKLHHKFAEETARLQSEAEKQREKMLALNEQRMKDLKIGDKVKLMGSPKSLGLNLPSYLANGTFKVLGVTKQGNVKCDWDGEKPFSIPPCCLEILR